MKKKLVVVLALLFVLSTFLVVVMIGWNKYQKNIVIGPESLIYDFIEDTPDVELISDPESMIDKDEKSEDGFLNGNGFLYWKISRSEEREPLVDCMFQQGDARYHWMMYRYERTKDAKEKFQEFTYFHYPQISKPLVTWGKNRTEFAYFYPYAVILNRGFIQTWYSGTDLYILLSETDEDGFAMKQQIKEYAEGK